MLGLKTQSLTKVLFDLAIDGIDQLCEPARVLELNNRLYVSDTNSHLILKIDLESGKAEIFIV